MHSRDSFIIFFKETYRFIISLKRLTDLLFFILVFHACTVNIIKFIFIVILS